VSALRGVKSSKPAETTGGDGSGSGPKAEKNQAAGSAVCVGAELLNTRCSSRQTVIRGIEEEEEL